MNEIRFLKLFDTVGCHLSNGIFCVGIGFGDNKLEAFWDLLKFCWKYKKKKELLKVRRIKY